MRRLLLALVALLYVFSIPWYRESGASTPLWLGLPEWVAVAVLCYLAAAALNAAAWLVTDIPETEDDLAPDPERDASGPDDPSGAG